MTSLFDFLPKEYYFNRPVKDMVPYKTIERDGQLVVVLNTLGISPEDIEITFESRPSVGGYLSVSGQTKNDLVGKDYSVSMRFYVRDAVDHIDWESENGLTYVYVNFVKPIEQKVLVSRKNA